MSGFIKRLLTGVWPRPVKLEKPKVFRCEGGPLDGERLALRTGSTLDFSMRGVTGSYVPSDTDPKVVNWKEKELL